MNKRRIAVSIFLLVLVAAVLLAGLSDKRTIFLPNHLEQQLRREYPDIKIEYVSESRCDPDHNYIHTDSFLKWIGQVTTVYVLINIDDMYGKINYEYQVCEDDGTELRYIPQWDNVSVCHGGQDIYVTHGGSRLLCTEGEYEPLDDEVKLR